MAAEKASLSSKALLIYDGACGFCQSSVRRFQKQFGDNLKYIPNQDFIEPRANQDLPNLKYKELTGSIKLYYQDTLYKGAEAIFLAYELNGKLGWLLNLYRKVFFIRWIVDFGYWLVSINRQNISKACKLN